MVKLKKVLNHCTLLGMGLTRNEKVISSSSIILCVPRMRSSGILPHRQRKEQWALGSSVVYNNRQRKEQLVFTWNYTCAVHQYTIGKERRSWLSRGTTHAQFSRIQQQAKKGGDGCHVALRMRCSVEYYTGKRRSSWLSRGTTHAQFSRKQQRQRKEEMVVKWHYACAVQQNTTQAKEGAVGFHVALRMRISVQYYIHLHMKIKEQLVFIGLRMHIAQFSSL